MSDIIGNLPVTLTNGTTADASQVMTDLNFIVNQVNANGQSISGLAAAMLGNLALGSLVSIQTFGSSGTYTPSTSANQALVLAVGGGGAGGGVVAYGGTNVVAAGSGGSGGATGLLWVPTGLTTETITIGGGGAPNGGSGPGGAGGATSFGSLMSCPGGVGGNLASNTLSYANPPALSGLPTGTGTILLKIQGGSATTGGGFTNTTVFGGNGGGGLWGAGGGPGQLPSGVSSGVSPGAGGSGVSIAYPGGPISGGGGAAGGMVIFEFV